MSTLVRTPDRAAAGRHAHMRVLLDNLLDAEADVDQMRPGFEMLRTRLEEAIARRDDLLHKLGAAIEEAQR